ncbi:MAG: hypothetical protein Q8S33_02820 [Myxococcales bacterium]|nr:hypothetical protein [Myxococcales bacterium]
MPRLALKLVQSPPGVTVSFREGGTALLGRAGVFTIGIDERCDILVRVEPWAWDDFCRDGWGGRRNTGLAVDDDGRWTADHLGHGGRIFLNGEELVRPTTPLVLGDRLAPSRALIFELVDADQPLAGSEPPAELLDAVAERPLDEGRWHVLADWLIEHEAPHALMAAYELKLRDGTNDPDLLGEYASARRQRHVLSELRFDHVTWKCGYVVACSLSLGPRDRAEPERLSRGLGSAQFGAVSSVTLQCNGTESGARLETVLAALPKTVRVVGLQFHSAVPIASLMALRVRPPKAQTVRLHLADPVGPLAPLVDVLVASGWQTLDFEATRLTDRAAELRELVERHPTTRFMLGGTSLSASVARSLDRPNVDWVCDEHDAVLVELETGAVLPLSRRRHGFAWGLSLVPFADGWTTPDGVRLFASGELVRGAGRQFLFLAGPSLNRLYREWLEAAARTP